MPTVDRISGVRGLGWYVLLRRTRTVLIDLYLESLTSHCCVVPSSVVGITETKNRHIDIIAQVGDSDRFQVKTAEECKAEKFQNIVFCAPPSSFDDYPGAIAKCMAEQWSGLSEGGAFIFTSSGGIYGPGHSELVVVNENSPLPDPEGNARSTRLINAEKEVLKHGGACLRLAGLYTMDRGAHNFWLTSGKDVSGREDGIINLLHYDDAAGAAMAALRVGSSVVGGNVFLISDGNPLTRRGICESTLKSMKYRDMKMPKFLGSASDPVGKIYDGSASNKALKWDPTYESFDAFMSAHA